MTLKGVAEWGAAMTGLVASMDAAVRKSVREGAVIQQKAAQANIGGAPRWVNGVNYPRGGGPGEISGKLAKGIKYSPVLKTGSARYSTTLRSSVIYANKTESRYPYFQPGVRASTPAVDLVFLKNYAEVIARA